MTSIAVKPTFTVPVEIPGPGGTKLVLKITFKHRTKTELEAYRETVKTRKDVDVIQDIAESWSGVDEPFTPESIEELCENWHAAAAAIADKYVSELLSARRGN